MKAFQKFSKEYLEKCKKMKPDHIVRFLEDFRLLYSEVPKEKTRLISIKIPESLLQTFRHKAELINVPYQTQIKNLMKEWLKGTPF